MNFNAVSRRRLIVQGAGLAAATTLVTTGAGALSAPAYAAGTAGTPLSPVDSAHLKEALRRFRARQGRPLTGRPSANHWEMHRAVDAHSELVTCPVPGTGLTVVLRKVSQSPRNDVTVVRCRRSKAAADRTLDHRR